MTFTLRHVPDDPEHVDLVCTCGKAPTRLLARNNDRGIAAAKREHVCVRRTEGGEVSAPAIYSERWDVAALYAERWDVAAIAREGLVGTVTRLDDYRNAREDIVHGRAA